MRASVLGTAYRVGILAVSAAAALAFSGGAPPQQPTFRAAVELVQVDVSVLDKDRRPVLGLTQSDFTALEDGKPQKILSFAAVGAPRPVASVESINTSTWVRDSASDVATNDLPEGRLFVLVLDDALIPFDPKMIADAKQIGSSAIDHLGPTDRMPTAASSSTGSTRSAPSRSPARHDPPMSGSHCGLRRSPPASTS
jgi:hypothetical protein